MPSIALALLLREAAVPEIIDVVPGDPEFASMVKARRRELHKITRLLQKGDIGIEEWYDQSVGVLLEGHTRGAYYGRLLAIQKQAKSDVIDAWAGQAAMDGEEYYLRGFAEALLAKDPRYWDAENERWILGAIEDRQDMYLGKLRGTANAAFLRESSGYFFDWLTGGVESRHCTECPEYEAASPWGADELPTVPGACDTPCLMECNCFLKREDDVTGFKPVQL
jgi:hypothetical protein